jgi:hypothetical protein
VSREDELRQRADEFARRAAAATNDEEKVQLLTLAQAYRELADEREAKGGSSRSPSTQRTDDDCVGES